MNSFRSIIELWTSREAMAADIGATSAQVSKWWQRDSLPSDWWANILDTSVARSAGVTGEILIALAARHPVEAQP
jgi:hypothetical protein